MKDETNLTKNQLLADSDIGTFRSPAVRFLLTFVVVVVTTVLLTLLFIDLTQGENEVTVRTKDGYVAHVPLGQTKDVPPVSQVKPIPKPMLRFVKDRPESGMDEAASYVCHDEPTWSFCEKYSFVEIGEYTYGLLQRQLTTCSSLKEDVKILLQERGKILFNEYRLIEEECDKIQQRENRKSLAEDLGILKQELMK